VTDRYSCSRRPLNSSGRTSCQRLPQAERFRKGTELGPRCIGKLGDVMPILRSTKATRLPRRRVPLGGLLKNGQAALSTTCRSDGGAGLD
jgi:hypothetical protein